MNGGVEIEAVTWTALQTCEDEHLASLFVRGIHDALAVLFDRYFKLAFSIAVRIVKDEAEAEEVVQVVFLDLSRALSNFDPSKGSFKIWLLQYAYHRALHRKRHLAANRFYHWVALEDASLELRIPLASDAIERAELLERLLMKTTSQRRKILELTYCEGLTASEVAVGMGLSVNVVRHELYRALAELRKLALTKHSSGKVFDGTRVMGSQESNAYSL